MLTNNTKPARESLYPCNHARSSSTSQRPTQSGCWWKSLGQESPTLHEDIGTRGPRVSGHPFLWGSTILARGEVLDHFPSSSSCLQFYLQERSFEILSKPHGRISLSNICLFSKQEVWLITTLWLEGPREDSQAWLWLLCAPSAPRVQGCHQAGVPTPLLPQTWHHGPRVGKWACSCLWPPSGMPLTLLLALHSPPLAPALQLYPLVSTKPDGPQANVPRFRADLRKRADKKLFQNKESQTDARPWRRKSSWELQRGICVCDREQCVCACTHVCTVYEMHMHEGRGERDPGNVTSHLVSAF